MSISHGKLLRPYTSNGRPFWLVPAKLAGSVAVPEKEIPGVLRWSFLLFVFSLTFENAALPFTSESLSSAKIAGLAFFVCYFFYNPFLPRLSSRKALPYRLRTVRWFLGYVAIYTLNGFFISDESFKIFIGRFLTLIQLVLLFWISVGLFAREKMAREFLLMFSMAPTILALVVVLRLPGLSQLVATHEGMRVSALGYEANTLATFLALAVVTLIGLYVSQVFKHPTSKLVSVALMLLLVAGVVSTGSRAGIGAFMVGVTTYLLPYRRSRRKLTLMTFTTLGMITMVYMVISNPVALVRWQQTLFEGELTGRGQIFPAAVAMVSESPVFGWQPVEFQKELARREGKGSSTRDAHNLFLHLFLEVGAVGAVPFLVGLWLCGRAAWRARTGRFGLLPLALLTAVLAANMAHTDLAWKPLWLILALALGASISALEQKRRYRMRLVASPRPVRPGVYRLPSERPAPDTSPSGTIS